MSGIISILAALDRQFFGFILLSQHFLAEFMVRRGLSAEDIDTIAPAMLPDCFFFERRPDA
jgi:hypothetical protein